MALLAELGAWGSIRVAARADKLQIQHRYGYGPVSIEARTWCRSPHPPAEAAVQRMVAELLRASGGHP